jgi:hypothetical protein
MFYIYMILYDYEMTWCYMKWHATWNDIMLHEMTWRNMKWHDATWNDMMLHQMTRHNMKCHVMKCRAGVRWSQGSQLWRGPWGARKGSPGSPKKGPGKEVAQKRGVKTKEGEVCVLEKGRKEEKWIIVKGSRQPLGTLGAPRGSKMGPTQSQGAQGSQKDRPRSNWCIKERKK